MGAIAPFDTSTSAPTTIFKTQVGKKDNDIPPIMDSLLPTAAFVEEPRAGGLAIQQDKGIGLPEFLNLATFLTSNNFPGDTDSGKLRKWLRAHVTMPVLKVLVSTKGPTAEALVENLFRFSIEDEDTSTVKFLLQAGVNPNGHKCRLAPFNRPASDEFTPLQLTLIRGNIELSLELTKAGSTTDEPNTGWKSSALALAIIGHGMRYNKVWGAYPWAGYYGHARAYKQRGDYDTWSAVDCYLPTQEATDNCLFRLIHSLISAGAAVNLIDMGQVGLLRLKMNDGWVRYRTFTIGLKEVHTPLSAASKYQKRCIVDLFIQNGADVTILTGQKTSPLHECLYSWDQVADDLRQYGFLRPLQDRGFSTRGCKSLDVVVEVVRSLINAGANVHEKIECRDMYILPIDYSGPEFYTIFDLGVLTGSMDVVNMFLTAGAQMTALSVKYVSEFKSLHGLNNFLCSGASALIDSSIIATSFQDVCLEDLTGRESIPIEVAAFLQAIRLGHDSEIEDWLIEETLLWRACLYEGATLTEAIENCCGKGYIRALRLILQSSLKCQVSLPFGNSLYSAIMNGHDEVIEALLSAGANINAMAEEGQTPLLASIMAKNESLLWRLMGMGAMLNPKATFYKSCYETHGVSGDALIASISWGDGVVISRLLERGADIEALGTTTHEYNETHCKCIRPLSAALLVGNSDLVRDLIQRGVKINNSPHDNLSRMTPLATAIQAKNYEMVDFLIRKGANPFDYIAIKESNFDNKLRGLLRKAIRSSYYPCSIEHIEAAAITAIIIDDKEMLEAMIFSPLGDMKFRLEPSFVLDSVIRYSSQDSGCMRMLLSSGADPNTTWSRVSSVKRSALDKAYGVYCNPQAVKLQLEAGAEADRSRLFSRQYSPIRSAVKHGKGKVAQILLSHGSNPNSVPISDFEQDYRTPLQVAIKNQDVEIVGMLLQYNADPSGVFNDEGNTNIDKNIKTYLPRTPLQEASLNGNKEIIELLLEHGADVNSPPVTGDGATALQYAAMNGFLGIAHLLLEHDADVNAPAAKTDGRTALEGAAEHGRLDMVQLLLNAGAQIFGDGQDQYENAIRRASGNGHHAIRRMLEKWRSER